MRRGTTERAAARRLYVALVARSRDPTFYGVLGVPDTLEGRFDMIVVHAVLLIGRLREGGAPGRRVAQALFDTMMDDMDRNLREIGIGDLGVGRRVKAMARAFYGRAAVYRRALAAGDETALAAALVRNVWGGAAPSDDARGALVAYVRASERVLDGHAAERLIAGIPAFAPPPAGALGR